MKYKVWGLLESLGAFPRFLELLGLGWCLGLDLDSLGLCSLLQDALGRGDTLACHGFSCGLMDLEFLELGFSSEAEVGGPSVPLPGMSWVFWILLGPFGILWNLLFGLVIELFESFGILYNSQESFGWPST